MRSRSSSRRAQPYVVTEAKQSRADDMAERERRYLTLMGIRIVCFILAVVLFLNHIGWYAWIPAIAAVFLPYFAVVVANSARMRPRTSGFREYKPPLPDRLPPQDPPTGSH